MADRAMDVRPSGTAWGAVLGGWVASVGMAAILSPFVAGPILAMGTPGSGSEISVAIPVVLGILLAFVAGGYVAGRMAGYRTSWHGLVTAFFGLFILLLAALAAGAWQSGAYAGYGIRSLQDVFPGLADRSLDRFADAATLGAGLAFIAAILGGWFGGLLAPSNALASVSTQVRQPVRDTRPRVVDREREERERPERERDAARQPTARTVPAVGLKGGERAEEGDKPRDVDSMHTPRTDTPRRV